MQLPPELEAMTPTDYTYYETGLYGHRAAACAVAVLG